MTASYIASVRRQMCVKEVMKITFKNKMRRTRLSRCFVFSLTTILFHVRLYVAVVSLSLFLVSVTLFRFCFERCDVSCLLWTLHCFAVAPNLKYCILAPNSLWGVSPQRRFESHFYSEGVNDHIKFFGQEQLSCGYPQWNRKNAVIITIGFTQATPNVKLEQNHLTETIKYTYIFKQIKKSLLESYFCSGSVTF